MKRDFLLAAVILFAAPMATAELSKANEPKRAPPDSRGVALPLKVYILAGQSNMQGHASISTFDSLADDPKTAPLLNRMRTPDGNPVVCERVWISSIGCQGDAYTDLTERTGKLTAGYGAPENKIGPEFTFGLTMEERVGGPILIIKTAWGGRSLHTDFRPPSAGPETINDYTLSQWKQRGLNAEEETAKIRANGGVYYRHMIEHVKRVLGDIKRVVPDYDPNQGYELAGFVWFQGFNDYVDGWTYPDQMKPGGYDLYAELLGHLIRDTRKDLSAPTLPFVIGVMGIDGLRKGREPPMSRFRQAQVKPTELPEFKGNVVAVETAPFWDDDLDSLHQRMDGLNERLDQEWKDAPKLDENAKEKARKKAVAGAFTPKELKRLNAGVSNGGYHYLGAAKILAPIGKAFAEAMLAMKNPAKPGEMAGYLLVPHSKVDASYDAGFSMYVSAWPLLGEYPGDRFQTGLLGTWMHAFYETPPEGEHYSDIEGGLGWWRDTRFATVTPKFIMGGVALNFSEWANGPGAGKGRDWNQPAGHYAIAQLSPWVLWPPDGLNLKQGTSGELFGYGYLPLPLTPSKKKTAGKDVPTGEQSWTLFLNTGNFKGPVAFFTPYFWSKPTFDHPRLAGEFLDTKPADPNKALQMETQYVPCFLGTDSLGRTFARVAPTSFPAGAGGDSVLVHGLRAYNKGALWNGVKTWFEGGDPVTGAIDVSGATLHSFGDEGGSTWEMYPFDTPNERKVSIDWNAFATPKALDEHTYGYHWDADKVTRNGSLTTLPEFFRLEKSDKGKEVWRVVVAGEVPAETGLFAVNFGPPRTANDPEPYVTPDSPKSCWKSPGPTAGPFTAKLGDGSVVTYSWFRFADQPAILNADLNPDEREDLQKKVEMIHRHWKKDSDYLPPNTVGVLADIDPALLVSPPEGLEFGYVPIVTRQAAE